jgi:hypothetical protein
VRPDEHGIDTIHRDERIEVFERRPAFDVDHENVLARVRPLIVRERGFELSAPGQHSIKSRALDRPQLHR